MTPEREQWLIEQAKLGHEHAFRELVQHLNPRVFRVARGILDTDAEAEDAVQESYVRAFRDLHRFRGDSRIATWITRIALNTAKMMARKKKPTEQLDTVGDMAELMDEHDNLHAPRASHPDHVVENSELRDLMEEAIGSLSPNLRLPFMLFELEGLSTREIADHLNIQTMAVKTRVYRARRQLRKELSERIGGASEVAFYFAGARCVGMADQVIGQLINDGIVVSNPVS